MRVNHEGEDGFPIMESDKGANRTFSKEQSLAQQVGVSDED